MRYRLTEDGALGPVQSSTDFVNLTVWLTLVVGIVFLVVGTRGHQRWLQFWGALTILCCAGYFTRGLFGVPF